MTAGSRRDDLEPADALDRLIDETLRADLHAHTVDLRERVLAGLDERAEARPAWWRLALRPALLPAAGAAIIVVGVLLTWHYVDHSLARIGAPRPAPAVTRVRPFTPVAPKAGIETARASVAPAGAPVTARGRRSAAPEPRITAASTLAMGAMTATVPVADTTLAGDDALPAQVLPGAMGGDLGEAIKPMPALRPILIQPIVTPPIVMAPPVSTLSPIVETIPTVGEITRDESRPGKSGGDPQ